MKGRTLLCGILTALLLLGACGSTDPGGAEPAQQPETGAAPAAVQLTASAQQSFPDVAEDAWFTTSVPT